MCSLVVGARTQRPCKQDADLRLSELKGRFLHITDFHPDPHYKRGATFESGCHRKDKKGKGKLRLDDPDVDVNGTLRKGGDDDTAGKWGSPLS